MGLGFCIVDHENDENGDHSVEAHWSYSGFMRFREKLAQEAGIELRTMPGFGSSFEDGKVVRHETTGDWNTFQDDIKDLLLHSDCDGYLTAEQCGVIAPRLKELVSRWSDDDFDKSTALGLVEGMDRCAGTGKMLCFC